MRTQELPKELHVSLQRAKFVIMQLWHFKKLAISSLHVTFRGIYIFMSAVSLIDVPVFLAVHVRVFFVDGRSFKHKPEFVSE